MTTNLSRYEDDLKRLVSEGHALLTSMQISEYGDEYRKALVKSYGDDEKAEAIIASLPAFASTYQRWYSEAKALIKQVIPDRLQDFVRHYERQANRKALQWDNYTIEDYLQRLSRSDLVPMKAGVTRMEQQLRIVESAQQRFTSSLFDIKQLVAADLFDGEIEEARVLAKGRFMRAAGAVAGVVMEKHLAQVCENHNIKVAKRDPSIGDLNDLLKNAGVIETPVWRANQYLADIRNLCDHSKAKEPTLEQVSDLIDGVAKIVKTIN